MSNNSRQNTRFRWKTAKELEKLYEAGIWSNEPVKTFELADGSKIHILAELYRYGYDGSAFYYGQGIGKVENVNILGSGLGLVSYKFKNNKITNASILVQYFDGSTQVYNFNGSNWVKGSSGTTLYLHTITLKDETARTYTLKVINNIPYALGQYYIDMMNYMTIDDVLVTAYDINNKIFTLINGTTITATSWTDSVTAY